VSAHARLPRAKRGERSHIPFGVLGVVGVLRVLEVVWGFLGNFLFMKSVVNSCF